MPDTIACRSCREPISVEATKCPHCNTNAVTGVAVVLAVVLGLPGAAISAFFGITLATIVDPSFGQGWPVNPFLAATGAAWVLIVAIVTALYADRRKRLGKEAPTLNLGGGQDRGDKAPWRDRHPRATRFGRYALYAFGGIFLLSMVWIGADEIGWVGAKPVARAVANIFRFAFFALALATVVGFVLDRREDPDAS